MARKRMFSLSVIDTDAFLDMPASAQALYFHLGMRADDEGFVDCPKKILRNIGANEDDMSCLIGNGYIIQFESGVVVIRDWKINNTLQSDRRRPTIYQDEMRHLRLDEVKRYYLSDAVDTPCIQSVSSLEPEIRLVENSKEEGSTISPAPFPPTKDEVAAYCEERGNGIDAERFFNYYTANGWVCGNGQRMKDWKAQIKVWESSERERPKKDKVVPNWLPRVME